VLLSSRIQPILLARYVQGVHEKMDSSFALVYEEDGFRRFKARAVYLVYGSVFCRMQWNSMKEL
jgi:hypothetical protein